MLILCYTAATATVMLDSQSRKKAESATLLCPVFSKGPSLFRFYCRRSSSDFVPCPPVGIEIALCKVSAVVSDGDEKPTMFARAHRKIKFQKGFP